MLDSTVLDGIGWKVRGDFVAPESHKRGPFYPNFSQLLTMIPMAIRNKIFPALREIMNQICGKCVICTSVFTSDDVAALRCGHTFHFHCVSEWVEHSKTCPICRATTAESHIVKHLYFDGADDPNASQVESLSMALEQVKNNHAQAAEEVTRLKSLVDKLEAEVAAATKSYGDKIGSLQARNRQLEMMLVDQQEIQEDLERTKNRLRACESQLDEARKANLKLKDELKREQDSFDGPASKRARVEDDDSQLAIKILIPSAAVGAIMGKGGEAIRNLINDHQCCVQVSTETYPGTRDRICSVKGRVRNVSAVIDVILERISEKCAKPSFFNELLLEVLRVRSGAGSNGENYASSVMVERQVSSDTIELEIPDTWVGAVLGPKAKTLKEIHSYSGCKVQVFKRDARPDLPVGTRLIRLSGNEEEMHLCKCMIERVVNEAQEFREGTRN